jgi:hypothetical protein
MVLKKLKMFFKIQVVNQNKSILNRINIKKMKSTSKIQSQTYPKDHIYMKRIFKKEKKKKLSKVYIYQMNNLLKLLKNMHQKNQLKKIMKKSKNISNFVKNIQTYAVC